MSDTPPAAGGATLPPNLDPSQTPIDQQTFAQLAASMLALVNLLLSAAAALFAWCVGSSDGGPNGDGRYPLVVNAAGLTQLTLCPAAIFDGSAGAQLVASVGPAVSVAPIMPADADLPRQPTNAIYVGVAGNLVVTMEDGSQATYIMRAGQRRFIRAKQVNAATTAGALVAEYSTLPPAVAS